MEGEKLGILFAVGRINQVSLRPVNVVFVACFNVASDEAVGEIGICGNRIQGVVFFETVSKFLAISAAEVWACLVCREDVCCGVVFAAGFTADQLAIGMRCGLGSNKRGVAIVVSIEAV